MAAPWGDEATLLDAAKIAIERGRISVGGGWSAPRNGKPTYLGGVFEQDGSRWVACRGEQRPGYARLLDATVALKVREQTAYALAILDPPAKAGHDLPSAEYHRRFRAAAWAGLGLVWMPAGCPPASHFEFSGPFPERLGSEIERILLGAARPEWASVKKSRDGEGYVRPLLNRLLSGQGFLPASERFLSYWRRGITDGAWSGMGSPRSIALEVKVDEDREAPFGQIVDDLGAFDAVVHVRFVTSETTRRKLHETQGLGTVRNRVREQLAVQFVDISFCTFCRGPRLGGGDYPYLVCDPCDERAVNDAGGRPRTDSMHDDGENPVFIDGKKCWRRYRFGGWITMHDPDDCSTLEAFYKTNKPASF